MTSNGAYCGPVHRLVSSTIPFKGDGEQYATTSNADWHIYYHLNSSGNCEYAIKKPIIVLDGYDPQDGTPYSSIYNDYLSYGNPKISLGDSLRDKGYDVIILNFPKLGQQSTTISVPATVQQENSPGNFTTTTVLGRDGGTDFIERNAFILVKLIQQINDSLAANSSTQKLVIVGPSMGGQISRYALAYMEKQNALNVPHMNHNTRLWISFDSPNWGANIPMALQNSLYFYGTTGRNVKAMDAYNQNLHTPAGKQLLIEQKDGLYNSANVRMTYMPSLANNGLPSSGGYPVQLRKIALLNGSGAGIQDFNPGALYVDLRGKQWGREIFKWRNWYMPAYNTLSSNTDLAITIPPPVVGSAKVWTFLSYLFGNFNIFVTGSNNITNINPHGSMDVVPGSNYKSIYKTWSGFDSVLQHTTNTTPIHNVLDSTHTFIPSVSALGFFDPNFTWYTRIDDRNLVCTNEIPFDNYYMPKQNEQHITLTPNNVAWLKQEVYKGETHSGCPTLCAFDISGNDAICANETKTYTINGTIPSGTPISWSAGSNITLGTNGAQSINATYGYVGKTIISVDITNSCGADFHLSKDVMVGLPSASFYLTNSSTDSCRGVATAAAYPNITHSWTDSYGTTSGTSNVFCCSDIGDNLTLQMTNTCGTSSYSHLVNIARPKVHMCAARIWYPHSGTTGNEPDIVVKPNPSADAWNINFRNADKTPTFITITDITGTIVFQNSVANTLVETIDCSTLAGGCYIARIQYSDGSVISVKMNKLQ